MITFTVVKDQHGWAVRSGNQMTTPFSTRNLAICEADRLAAAIRRHGVLIEITVEEPQPAEEASGPSTAPARSPKAFGLLRPLARV